ncbi:MAG: glycosyltransferase family 4 protein [Candidatus Aenigmatarchaeota archaeon]
MRVLLVLRGNKKSLFGGGGAERRFVRVIQYLKNHGVDDVKIICNKEMAINFFKAGLIEDSDILVFPNRYLGIIGFNLWLIYKILKLKPDIIHLILIQRSLLPFYLFLLFYRKIFVVLTVAWAIYIKGDLDPITKFLSMILFSRANIIDLLYPSAAKNNIFSKYSNKLRITPCSFTDYNEYTSLNSKDNIISFVGRLIDQKRPFLFLEVIKSLKSEDYDLIKNWKFVILGDGKLKREIIDFIEKNDLRDVCELSADYTSKNLLSRSKIFVTLQYPTNYPSQALLEAMACENAVIATRDEDTKRIINDENGLLVNDSLLEIRDALKFLMLNESLVSKLGKNAREFVLREHNIERFSKYLLEIWEQGFNKK